MTIGNAPTIEEQIEKAAHQDWCRWWSHGDLCSCGAVSAIEKPVPVEPDYWNKLGKEHYWENEARRYAGNSDYWRERAEKAEAINRRMVEQYRDLVAAAEKLTRTSLADNVGRNVSQIAHDELSEALAKLEES